jgi:hypothetical protein
MTGRGSSLTGAGWVKGGLGTSLDRSVTSTVAYAGRPAATLTVTGSH